MLTQPINSHVNQPNTNAMKLNNTQLSQLALTCGVPASCPQPYSLSLSLSRYETQQYSDESACIDMWGYKGEVLFMFSKYICIKDSNEAGVLAILEALRIRVSNNFHNIVVGSDFLNAISWMEREVDL